MPQKIDLLVLRLVDPSGTAIAAFSRHDRHPAIAMRDRDIRAALWMRLTELHAEDPDTLILDELGVCEGEARADVAVVNGSLAAFEIKSDKDTLARLPGQIEAYRRVFDVVTLIVGMRHVEHVIRLAPQTWGIVQACKSDALIELMPIRDPQTNGDVEPFAQAQLLWRDEALEILEAHGLAKGLRSKPRRILWRAIAEHLSPSEVGDAVRNQLKARQDWRSDPPPLPGGETLPPSSR